MFAALHTGSLSITSRVTREDPPAASRYQRRRIGRATGRSCRAGRHRGRAAAARFGRHHRRHRLHVRGDRISGDGELGGATGRRGGVPGSPGAAHGNSRRSAGSRPASKHLDDLPLPLIGSNIDPRGHRDRGSRPRDDTILLAIIGDVGECRDQGSVRCDHRPLGFRGPRYPVVMRAINNRAKPSTPRRGRNASPRSSGTPAGWPWIDVISAIR